MKHQKLSMTRQYLAETPLTDETERRNFILALLKLIFEALQFLATIAKHINN